MCHLIPSADCLVELVEMPFTVIDMGEVRRFVQGLEALRWKREWGKEREMPFTVIDRGEVRD
jgi:hypothetical protein